MKIPNAQHAIVDIRKVQDYCLNPQHNSGKHKARMVASALGMGPDDAEALREVLLQAVKTCHARLGREDVYGRRYTIDFVCKWRGRQATIQSGWIIDRGSEIPRLVTAYPLQDLEKMGDESGISQDRVFR